MSLIDLRDLSDREARIVALADGLAADHAARADRHDRDGTLPEASFASLRASGYAGLTVPEALGGLGASLFELALAQQRLARGDASVALAAAMTAHLLGSAREAGGWPPSLYAEVALDAAERGALINSVASEPDLGSPSRGGLPRTTAAPDGGGWVLRGRKTWATGGPALARFLVTAATPDGRVARFIVPADAAGVRLEPTWAGALALRASAAHDLVLDGVRVPGHHRVPSAPSHPASAAWFWAAVAATYLGVGIAALEGLAAYARERTPTALGRPIATLPAVRQATGRIEVTLAAAQAVLHEATRAWAAANEPGEDLLPRLAAAKHLCTNAAIAATDLALRTAGGASLTRELPLERHFRDARAGLAHPPSDDAALETVGAARLEDAGRDALDGGP